MTIQATIKAQDYSLLRRTLQANAIFSTLSGLLLTIGAQPVTEMLGLSASWVIFAVGLSLLPFAGFVYFVSRKAPLNRTAATLILEGDILWVIASAVLLFSGWVQFSATGWWAVAIVADIVAVFAVLEWIGLRQK
ncbi:MAG: hypothetical protein R3264_12940 [Anaerolineae bacterium]|nr:hypothetical protein [Anaerolineae bacterium]